MNHSMFRALAAVAFAAILSSCASDKKVDYCPGIASVLDAAIATQFKPGMAPDPANVLFTVQISDVKGKCIFDKQGKTSDSQLAITFQGTRAAPGPAVQYTVPYWVAVTQATRVMTKDTRSVTIAFEAGATTATAEEDVDSIKLVTDGDKKPYDYQTLVGLQLTKAQLDYNRTVGIFGQ
ncbi:MAG TPA: hypothetical protein VIJ85_12040 [Rhizomicrobium sp.]